MDPIDQMIAILQRVKNCDKALSNLEMAEQNLLFKENLGLKEHHQKYLDHVRFLIKEAIRLIKDP